MTRREAGKAAVPSNTRTHTTRLPSVSFEKSCWSVSSHLSVVWRSIGAVRGSGARVRGRGQGELQYDTSIYSGVVRGVRERMRGFAGGAVPGVYGTGDENRQD